MLAGMAKNAKRREENLSAFAANSRVDSRPLFFFHLPETYP
jgi:hypothetical protein